MSNSALPPRHLTFPCCYYCLGVAVISSYLYYWERPAASTSPGLHFQCVRSCGHSCSSWYSLGFSSAVYSSILALLGICCLRWRAGPCHPLRPPLRSLPPRSRPPQSRLPRTRPHPQIPQFHHLLLTNFVDLADVFGACSIITVLKWIVSRTTKINSIIASFTFSKLVLIVSFELTERLRLKSHCLLDDCCSIFATCAAISY